jgi:parallel beta-helix repeat protein
MNSPRIPGQLGGMAGLWLALAAIEVGAVSAHTFYVATGGDDHHPGTRSRPFRHVGRGVGAAQPGDVVLVEDGVYQEQVRFSRGGTADAWIVLRPAHEVDVQQARPRVTISPEGGQGINLAGHSYIRVEGFEIAGGFFGIVSSGSTLGHHTAISNNLVHDMAASGIQLNDGDYRTITRNVVHHCARSWKGCGSGISIFTPRALDAAPGFHNVIARNICHDNSNPPGGTDGNGIIIDCGKKNGYTAATLIENNLTYRNGGAGIHVYRSTNLTVRNNTSWWNRQLPTKWSWRGDLSNQESDDVVWVNNIAWANPAAAPHNTALLEQPGGKNVIWRHNISYAETPGKASFNRHGPAPAGNLLGVDPMLVDPPSDFRLRPGSPAIRAGTSAHGVPGHDVAGNPRSGPLDIGAYVAGAAKARVP